MEFSLGSACASISNFLLKLLSAFAPLREKKTDIVSRKGAKAPRQLPSKCFPALLMLLFVFFPSLPAAAQSWTAKLDKDIRFYQPTEFGVVIVGTEKSLYAID